MSDTRIFRAVPGVCSRVSAQDSRNLAKVLIARSGHHSFVLVIGNLASPSRSLNLMKDVFCSEAWSSNLPRLSCSTKILPARVHSWIHKISTNKRRNGLTCCRRTTDLAAMIACGSTTKTCPDPQMLNVQQSGSSRCQSTCEFRVLVNRL